MTTLLFIHGTGVRGAAYDASFSAIRAQAAHHLGPAVEVQPCQWGDHVGASIDDDALSVPGYEVGRSTAGAGPSAAEQEVRWRLLYEDPLYELRSYAALTTGGDLQGLARSPAQRSPGAQALAKLGALQPSAADGLARSGHAAARLLGPALALLSQDGVFDEAMEAEALAAPERSRAIVARAFVAAWAQAAAAQGLPALDGSARDALYEDAVAVLGGATKGLVDEFIGALGGLASRIATPILRRRRTGVTDASFAATHDILRYQTPHGGAAVRGLIAERIRACAAARPGPVYLLAHSLGGIASVELLASTRGLPVAGLITCGSQAPYLYEADALSLLRRGQPLPAHFPRWLNVFDLNDLLSYVGAGLFGARVVDQEVRSRQPFPQSHSAYWANDQLWQHVKAFIA